MGFFKQMLDLLVDIANSPVETNNVASEKQTPKHPIPEQQLSRKQAEMMAPQWLKIANDCVVLTNETSNPKVFFSRFDLLIENLEKLSAIENKVHFNGKPSRDLQLNLESREEDTNNFIDRYTDKLKEEIQTLSTEKARQRRLELFEAFASEYQEYFTEKNKEKIAEKSEELKIELEGYSPLNNIHEIELLKANTPKIDDIASFAAKFPAIKEKPGSFNWLITVSFGKTTSKNLSNAVFLAKQGKNFKVEEIDGTNIYTVDFSDSREDFKKFNMLYDVAGRWKTTAFFINGEMLDNTDLMLIKQCYGMKCTSVETNYCYGVNQWYPENPFGCHQLQISTGNNPWWNYYKKNGPGYILDKDKLIERIELADSTYKHCPAFNKERILAVTNALPIQISDKEYEKLMAAAHKRLRFY